MKRVAVKTPLKLVSLFSGIGGLDFGFEAAGFHTRATLEFNKHACAAMRRNRKWIVIEGDINAVPSKTIMAKAGVAKGEIDMIIGGPPCQPFSSVGKRRGMEDPRVSTLAAYMRVLGDLQPRAFLIENVAGIAHDGKNEGMKFIVRGIDEVNKRTGSNYKIHWRLLNCAEYGVPQLRKRIFMVGSRDGRSFAFPRQQYGSPDELRDNLFGDTIQPYRTAWDAIGDLKNPTDPAILHSLRLCDERAGILPSIPEGGNFLWHTEFGSLGKKPLFAWQLKAWYPTVLRKLSKRLPSWTILAQPRSHDGPFHWKNRRLTFKELCRLQTFPSDLVVECSPLETQRLLGNAVPSLMAEVLAREIRKQLLDDPIGPVPLSFLPPLRADVPPAEPFIPLPWKYCALATRGYGSDERNEIASRDWFGL